MSKVDKKCDNIEISEKILFSEVEKIMKKVFIDTEKFVETYYNKRNKNNRIIEENKNLLEIENKLKKKENLLKNIYKELYEIEDEFEKNIKEKLVKETKEEYKVLENTITELKEKIKNLEETEKWKETLLSLSEKVRLKMKNLDYKGKIQLAREFIDKIIISKDWKVKIILRFEIPDDLSGISSTQNFNEVNKIEEVSGLTIFFVKNFEKKNPFN